MNNIYKALMDSNFVNPGKQWKKLMILSFIGEKKMKLRKTAEKLEISVGLVSKYVNQLQKDAYLDSHLLLTKKGIYLLEKQNNKLEHELLKTYDLVKNQLGTKKVTIAAVASKSGFSLNNLKKDLSVDLDIHYYSTAYEAFKNDNDVDYFIIGSVPAMKMMSFGLQLERKLDLLPENHYIVEKGNNEVLYVIGNESVSASICKNAQIFGIEIINTFKRIKYISNIYEAFEKLNNGEGSVLIWEPFDIVATKEFNASIIHTFSNNEIPSQVLIKNSKRFLENTIMDEIESKISFLLETLDRDGLHKASLDFLQRGVNYDKNKH